MIEKIILTMVLICIVTLILATLMLVLPQRYNDKYFNKIMIVFCFEILILFFVTGVLAWRHV